jgi:hypothetical protein
MKHAAFFLIDPPWRREAAINHLGFCRFDSDQGEQFCRRHREGTAKGGSGVMPPFLYRCPTTGYRVQGFVAEEVPADTYEPVTCTACQRVHLVNPATGKVLGERDE